MHTLCSVDNCLLKENIYFILYNVEEKHYPLQYSFDI